MALPIDPAWQQGSIIPRDVVSAALPSIAETLSSDDIIIVVSQSCDVVCSSLESEPFVDVLIARSVDEMNGNNTFGKNPRVIDFPVPKGDTSRYFRCRDSERARLDRAVLASYQPTGLLPPELTSLLANWTGRRYTRPALPDAFNRRRRPTAQRVSRIADRYAHDIAALYVLLDRDRELPDDENYRIVLVGTAVSAIAANPTRFDRVIEAVAAIAKALSCDGIDVVDAVAKSEDDVSLTEARSLTRLDLDYISVRQGVSEAAEPQS